MMSSPIRLLLAGVASALVAVTASACGDDGHQSGCGLEANCTNLLTYSAGMVETSEEGNVGVRLVSVDPAPPDVVGTWTIEITDGAGDPITGGSVALINAWSIDCGHFGLEAGEGVDVTDNGDDTFTFMPDYAHGGPWDVEIDVSDGTVTERVVFGFCLPQTGDGHDHSH